MKRKPTSKDWFTNCGGWSPCHDIDLLRRGIAAGLLDEQDQYGMTALSLAVVSGWTEGVELLLASGANTEIRYHRTGETTLRMALYQPDDSIIRLLIAAGADADAPNHWGLTPREWSKLAGRKFFARVRRRKSPLPPPIIQNAEHLADHYHPRFKIPERSERERMRPGQAVNLYVYGPKSETKKDAVKVRIESVNGRGKQIRYTGTVETPLKNTHLTEGMSVLEFGPEHIASVYITRPAKSKK